MLSNWNGPSEQCTVESNCQKHKVLQQLKAASFEQMSFHIEQVMTPLHEDSESGHL